MMGKHEHSFRQKGNGEVVPTPAPAGHALIVLVRQVEPGSRLRAAVYLNADLPPTADDEGVAQEFDVAVRRVAVPLDSEALCTLIEKYRAHRSQAGDA
jgi:hypothetical protein